MNKTKKLILQSPELCGRLVSLLDDSKSLIRHSIRCPNKHVWYGYYDHNPCNNQRVLFHQLHSLKNAKNVDICIYDISSRRQKLIAQSSAFSSQLATRLSWISQNTIHYNSFNDGSPVTICHDINTGSQILLPFQFWNFSKISEQKIIYASLNMTRLNRFREGYGYNSTSSTYSSVDFESNYLRFYSVDHKGSYKMLYALEQDHLLDIANECQLSSNFYLNHALFSPDSSSCVFCIHSAGVSSKDTQLVCYKFKNKTSHILLPGLVVSHHCYISNTELLIFVAKNGQGSYIVFNLESFTYTTVLSNYNVDGHPCFAKPHVILDTYPNRFGIQKLLISNSIDESPRQFFSIYSPRSLNSGPLRVDFHPRVDVFNKLVWIDILRDGYRQLLGVKLPLTPSKALE